MKVFISSTYKDLIDYRAAAIRAVEGTNYQASKMEVFGARPDEPLDACLNEVEESDFFLGIYAHRYGYVPASSDISITEMEYAHAKKLGKTIYCFVIDEENQPWLPKFIEGEPGAAKLKDFKHRIQTDHVCAFFTSPEDLGMKVANALSHYAANRQPANHQSSSIVNRLPHTGNTLPSQPYFFGREEELKTIAAALSPKSRTWGVLIYGPGGIGKTALAIEAAHRAPATDFDIKVFISAKERELTSTGEVSSKDFSHNSFFSILNEMALQIDEEGIPRLAPDERANTLKLALNNKKVLLTLDNLETLNNDDRDRLYQFLRYLPQGNKAVITSRRRDETVGEPIRLEQLQQPEAERLIAELAKRNPKLNYINNTDSKELFFAASGNPLIIRWIIGQVGRDNTNIKTVAEAIKFMRQAPSSNDPLDYVFGDLLNSLIPTEKMVLSIMVFLNTSPKIEWIAKTIGYSETTIETVCDELVNRSILVTIQETNSYFLPHISRQFIKKKLTKEVTEAEKKLANHAFKVVVEFGGKKNPQTQKYLTQNWPLIFAALPFYIKHDNVKLQIVCDALDSFLSSNGLLDEWLWLNEQAEIVAYSNEDHDNAGAKAYKVGLIHSYRGESADVLLYAKRAEEHWKEFNFKNETFKSAEPFVNYLRGIGYKLEKDYPKAIKCVNNAIKEWEILLPTGTGMADSLNILGEIQIELGETENSETNYSNAEIHINEALRIANKISYTEAKAKYKGNLARLALKCNDWSKAIILANEALIEAKDIGDQEELARSNLVLASAYLQLGYVGNKGLETSQEAVEIFTRLRHKDLPLAEKLLEQWRRKTGRGV